MDLGQLVKKRGICKCKLTFFSKFVASLQAKTDLTDVELLELKERISAIEDCKVKFNQYQSEIEEHTNDPNELENQLKEGETFENNYFFNIALTRKIINDNEHSTQVPPLKDFTQTQAVASHQLSNVRLPTISLPKYSGSYHNWLEFRDTFQSLIHDNITLTGVQKFHYLRASLEGDAAHVIKSLELSEDNYEVAWDALLERYDSNRLLVQNHVRALFNMEQIQKESASGIRKILDEVTKNLRALVQLKEPIEHWDTLLIYLVVSKLDNNTLKHWESRKSENSKLSFEDLKNFLKGRAELLEAIVQNDVKRTSGSRGNTGGSSRGFLATDVTGGQEIKCAMCGGRHAISTCDNFIKLSVKERLSKARYLRLCMNCLKRGHFNRMCRMKACSNCGEKHHFLLHGTNSGSNVSSQAPKENNVNTGETRNVLDASKTSTVSEIDKNQGSARNSTDSVALSACSGVNQVLLSTVQIKVFDRDGGEHVVRALLDSGAQSSFITQDLCKKLGLLTENINFVMRGLNEKCSSIRSKCKVRLQAVQGNYETELHCLVIDIITGCLPQGRVNPSELNIPSNLKLADPTFYESNAVEILIGADLYYDVICGGMITLGRGPVLQKTRFGWVVAGPMNNLVSEANCYFSQNIKHGEGTGEFAEIQISLQKFWQLEEVDVKPIWSDDEKACEEYFIKTTRRAPDGRFIVSLLLKTPPTKLGESFNGACKRFLSLESKFQKKAKFKEMYIDFMSEYAQLGHMERVKIRDNELCYYMPHKGVLREESLTTKLRVVFDASAPTSSGFSLNHLQVAGPTIQQDLFSILLRFRQHKYVVAADIAKMYRQVLLNPAQRCLQRVLWRENPENELEAWELKTVTYGTTAASFLVIRCMFQLAEENSVKYSELAQVIKSDFYVDDLLTGADTVDDAANICKGVADILKQGCFDLRKFYSNNNEVLKYVNNEGTDKRVIEFGEQEKAKPLGIIWCPHSDILQYKISQPSDDTAITKRVILSEISRIFDPLGLLGPCVIRVKIMLQKLWLEKLLWDQPVPLPIKRRWEEFTSGLVALNDLRIERHAVDNLARRVELHGFCDASEAAYGGAIYIRSTHENGEVSVKLLCAKSRVAPLKTVSLPRLELLGAVVLARLSKKVKDSVRLSVDECIFWSDSMIVISWLKAQPYKLKTFVSNRVSEIQSLTGSDQWRHVPSGDNPADILSRGIAPKEIIDFSLWWHGPRWLKQSSENWPNKIICCSSLPDVRKDGNKILIAQSNEDIFNKFSDLTKLKRVFAWGYRFIENCRIRKDNQVTGSLSLQEMKNVELRLIKVSQSKSYSSEIKRLNVGKNLEKCSKIINLNPFLDERGILRVGGRLTQAKFAFEKKHPAIISSNCTLSNLIIKDLHVKLLHAGPRHVLANVREEFWIVGGKRLCNKVINQCITCYRFKTGVITPIMAPLPELRLSPRYPFEVTGVDYGGPFMIKSKAGRGFRLSKAYICLFVCFTIKAVHLELVHDLTKEAFLAALRRFVSRRGKPNKIYSDNGTNFVAACHELRDLSDFINSEGNDLKISAQKEGIEWKFIPPHSPHFGGLWEAGIKSVKFHLKRILKDVFFTFEQFYTVLVQVEAILNSRPLSALSNSPEDLVPLTPAHFIVGRPLTALPEYDVSAVPVNRLSLYQHMQQVVQHLWSRWSKEYVSELQTRSKWHVNHDKLKKGALVLIKEDNQPPLKWKLGRVEELHPGKDGVSRVATVRTQSGLIKRSFAKICPLPLDED